MSSCERFMISSESGQRLDARLWKPHGQVRAVVQFVHGMAEHAGRYEEFARVLNAAGIAVAGHTQLGHGAKAPVRGFFAARHGWDCLVADVRRLQGVVREQYRGVPYFLMGQGMGSLLVRCCLAQQTESLQGAILIGSCDCPDGKIRFGKALARMKCFFGGKRKPMEWMEQMDLRRFCKPFEPIRTEFDWLSRDAVQVERYLADEYCGFPLTGGGYRDLFRGIQRMKRPEILRRTPKEIPLLMLTGDHDPVGDMGRSVEKAAQAYRDAGCTSVEVRSYPDSRHDLLHEIDRAKVFRDVIIFVDEHCK